MQHSICCYFVKLMGNDSKGEETFKWLHLEIESWVPFGGCSHCCKGEQIIMQRQIQIILRGMGDLQGEIWKVTLWNTNYVTESS